MTFEVSALPRPDLAGEEAEENTSPKNEVTATLPTKPLALSEARIFVKTSAGLQVEAHSHEGLAASFDIAAAMIAWLWQNDPSLKNGRSNPLGTG